MGNVYVEFVSRSTENEENLQPHEWKTILKLLAVFLERLKRVGFRNWEVRHQFKHRLSAFQGAKEDESLGNRHHHFGRFYSDNFPGRSAFSC